MFLFYSIQEKICLRDREPEKWTNASIIYEILTGSLVPCVNREREREDWRSERARSIDSKEEADWNIKAEVVYETARRRYISILFTDFSTLEINFFPMRLKNGKMHAGKILALRYYERFYTRGFTFAFHLWFIAPSVIAPSQSVVLIFRYKNTLQIF